MTEGKPQSELMAHEYLQKITYHYAAGYYGSRFFKELKENKKIYGVKCPSCQKVWVPPRISCPECLEEMNNWVEVGPRGTLIGGTAINHAFPDPITGELRKTPYGYGLIQLDGASVNWAFYLKESDGAKMKPGMRLEPVFAEERKGDLSDILHFIEVKE